MFHFFHFMTVMKNECAGYESILKKNLCVPGFNFHLFLLSSLYTHT